jgi:putative Holliday junction resolvase
MEQTSGPPGPVLGLDLGDARIGVALSDPDRRVAIPLGTVKTGSPPGELRSIADIAAEHGVTAVVVGLPVMMSGERGERAQRAVAFARALEDVLTESVEMQDERLSTVEAERRLRSSGVRTKARRAVVDKTAATVILQSWLDARAG